MLRIKYLRVFRRQSFLRRCYRWHSRSILLRDYEVLVGFCPKPLFWRAYLGWNHSERGLTEHLLLGFHLLVCVAKLRESRIVRGFHSRHLLFCCSLLLRKLCFSDTSATRRTLGNWRAFVIKVIWAGGLNNAVNIIPHSN